MYKKFLFGCEDEKETIQTNKEMPLNTKVKKQNSALFGKSICSNEYSKKADVFEQIKEVQPLFNGKGKNEMNEMLIKEEKDI